jgi:hypothetical protein
MSREEFQEYTILGRTISYEEHTIKECKQYLNETDYAIIKMYETVVQGGSIIEMLKEYKEVLTKRKEARQKINELEREAENGN